LWGSCPAEAVCCHAQLADFGLSRVLETNGSHVSTQTHGTLAYQPGAQTPRTPLFLLPSCQFRHPFGESSLDRQPVLPIYPLICNLLSCGGACDSKPDKKARACMDIRRLTRLD
jgi:hypothetical protein